MSTITTFKKQIEINKPKNEVWQALADFGNVCHGHPGVKSSHITSLEKAGIGATRHCDFTMMGASADEIITQWNEGQNITVEVFQLDKMPGLNTVSLDLAIQENDNKTVLTGTMNYTMKNAFFDLMNHLVMKKMNAKLLDGILAGHKLYIETGTIVTEKTKLDLTQVKSIL